MPTTNNCVAQGSIRSTAVLWVVGIDQDGFREHLGLWTGPAESLETWGGVFRDLVDRGVAGVEMIVSDEHLGLVQALQRYFPHATHQRCTVHYLRNALAYVSSDVWKRDVRDSLRDVWAAPTREEAEERLQRLITRTRKPAQALADWLECTAQETLTFLDHVQPEHRRLLKTTNSMEHDHAEVRRRSRVVRRRLTFAGISHGNGSVSGEWQVVAGGTILHGDIDCLTILPDGRSGRISGIVEQAKFTTFEAGTAWAMEFVDNGQGAGADADVVSDLMAFKNATPEVGRTFCETGELPEGTELDRLQITQGNFQVHVNQ